MRTEKGTRKINDWEKAPGSVITCQKCGKMLQRSLQTDSVIICPRCGRPNYTYSENNITVQFPAVLLDSDNSRTNIMTAITALRKLWTSPIKGFVPGDEPD